MAIPGIRRWPMVRIFTPFAAGILAQFYLPFGFQSLLIAFLANALILGLYGLIPSAGQFRWRLGAGVLMNASLATGGMLILQLSMPSHRSHWYWNHQGSGDTVYARLTDLPKQGSKTVTAPAAILGYRNGGKTHNATGKIVITILKSATLPELVAGQTLCFSKQPAQIPYTANPGGFDYQRYMLLQGIRHQVFLADDDYQLLDVQRSWFQRLLDRMQAYVLRTIRDNIKGAEESGLAEALLIGYRNDLDRDLVQSYSNTGVVHVIAISGLHLALVYLLLGKACDLLRMNRKYLKPLIVLGGLWLFALLAGGSPSVVRSAVMFSVIVVGELINRKAHILNSLAASAFILLCYNPLWLWDLGFQLSYIAVLSLALTATPIYQMLYIRNPLLDNLWKLVSVTIAAQIFTTPVSLFNFHKFPLMFLFTNCICVPLSSLVLLGELALCVVAPVQQLAGLTGSMLHYGLKLMNDVVRYFERYPVSNFQPVQLSIVQTLLLYGFLALAFVWLRKRSNVAQISAMACLLLVFLLRWLSFKEAAQQQKLIVYNVPGVLVADHVVGRRATSWHSVQSTAGIESRYAGPTRIRYRVDTERLKATVPGSNELVVMGKLKILVLNERSDAFKGTGDTIDILLLSHNSVYRKLDRLRGLKLRQVVADASNSRSAIQAYTAFFHSIGIPFHAVSNEGAFVRNLN